LGEETDDLEFGYIVYNEIQVLYLYMATIEVTSDSLNEQQLLMLRLLKKPLPEASFIQIRQLAVKLLAKQLDETIEDWETQNGIDAEHYEELGKKHFRSPTKSS
jgi:capsid portal protein